eukprot:3887527-Amphidinium_carterae.1
MGIRYRLRSPHHSAKRQQYTRIGDWRFYVCVMLTSKQSPHWVRSTAPGKLRKMNNGLRASALQARLHRQPQNASIYDRKCYRGTRRESSKRENPAKDMIIIANSCFTR